MSKKRSQRSAALQRRVDTRAQRQRFLIVCEGKRTEPSYFLAFRVPRVVVKGIGYNTLSLVEQTIRLRDEGDYDQTWCVFDRDDFPAEHFNAALTLAQRNKIRVAYSNEAFELWYLLHFHYFNTGISRQQYSEKLSSLLGHRYKKNSATMYAILLDKQQAALQNAHKLLNSHRETRPGDANPSTTVHLLVEALNNAER